jgi:outer membrane protein assembly factor BamA
MQYNSRSRKPNTVAVVFLTFALGLVPWLLYAQSSVMLPLGKITVTGLQRHKETAVIPTTGLKLGEAVNQDSLKGAAEKLGQTGYFESVNFKYRFADGKMQVEFMVLEAPPGLPCVFDNFVWASDLEIHETIRSTLPIFDGTAPQSGSAQNEITKALEGFLKRSGVTGQIDYILSSGDLGGTRKEHVFSVKGHLQPVCSLHFPGAEVLKEELLRQTSESLIGVDYSRMFVRSFVESNLRPVYRNRGHLRVRFQEPVAKAESGMPCEKNGMTVSVQVEEGVAYRWGRTDWAGNSILATDRLEKSLGMQPGEIASWSKIEEGMDTVHKEYTARGYLEAFCDLVAAFENMIQTVNYHIAVREGPQYRMGKLIVTGLSDRDAKRLREKWELPEGDVYNAVYARDFLTTVFKDGFVITDKDPRSMGMVSKADRQLLTADVMLEFK